jgi:hypothetical protein
MLMTVRKKILLFVMLGLAVLAIVLLSAGISNMELAGSNLRAIAPEESGPEFFPSPQDILDEPASAASIAFSLVLLIALLISIIHFILSPEARKRVIQRFLRLVFVIFAVYVISTRLGSRLNLDNQAPEGDARGTFPFAPIEEIAASFPPWASYLLSFMLLAIAAGVVWFIWQRSRSKPPALDLLAGEARTALQELRSGADFKNTIIHCYYEMCAVLNKERGIRRAEGMTAREFENELARLGMPVEPVSQLTRLFEMARYGDGSPNPEDENNAWECLSAIAGAEARSQ